MDLGLWHGDTVLLYNELPSWGILPRRRRFIGMYPLNILCVLHLTMPTVHIISLHIITLGGLRLKRDVRVTGTSPYWKIKTSPSDSS